MAKHISNGRLLKKLAAYAAQNRVIRKGFLRSYGKQIARLGISIDLNRRVLDPDGKLLRYQAPEQKPAPEAVVDPTRIIDESKFSQEDGPSRFAPSAENAVGSEEPKQVDKAEAKAAPEQEPDKSKPAKSRSNKPETKAAKGKSADKK